MSILRVDNHQLPARVAKRRSARPHRSAYCFLPPALQNGGFVPDFCKGRSFVIMQIGGFVFQKVLSFQPSARGFQILIVPPTSRESSEARLPRPSDWSDCPLPNDFRLLPSKRWLRSGFLQGSILCYHANRWLRFSKKAHSLRPSAFSFQPLAVPNLPRRCRAATADILPTASAFQQFGLDSSTFRLFAFDSFVKR